MEILTAVIVLGLAALILGLILSFASSVFAVKQDEREVKLREVLPGANCGACGFAGCDNFAESLNKGECEANLCIPGGKETAEKLGEILGIEISVTPKKAVLKCKGCINNATNKFEYTGLASCTAAASLFGGQKECAFGCLGLGDCVNACDFSAISIKNGIAQIDEDICGGCGKCATVCPKNIIDIKEYPFKATVVCKNKDKGAVARKVCKTACIGCSICVKNCEASAISVTDFLAEIDETKCTNCGVCIEKCPQKCIK